jgi:hypothetical protein
MLAKEQAKINRKREIFEQRRQRILNAKVRIIGLDINGLNEQVEEKKRMKDTEKEQDRFARMQALEVEKLLAASFEEERQMREFQMNQIKKCWEDAKEYKKQQAALPPPIDFDSENAGPAAALRFVGEDPQRKERHYSQKRQMHNWVQEQLAEKAHLKHLMKQEEMSYAEMLKAIDEIREANEREEREMRQYLMETVKQQNREVYCHLFR